MQSLRILRGNCEIVSVRIEDISLSPDRLLSVPRVMNGTSPRLLINPTHSSWHESAIHKIVGVGETIASRLLSAVIFDLHLFEELFSLCFGIGVKIDRFYHCVGVKVN